MMASLIMPAKWVASFSNRVAMRRRFFSPPMQRSTTLRRR